jgi:pSer/pThr/pTyr-binding forkhead associated (FHA) protein
MATKQCANGHHYDATIYGDNCPFCPSSNKTKVNPNMGGGNTQPVEPTKPTDVWPPVGGKTEPYTPGGGQTVLRTKAGSNAVGRKLVGLLITYDQNPNGDVHKIYEGRNLIGRRATCDIPIPGDENMSSEHLLILYRDAEGIFWAADQNSSNGTYINGEFVSERKRLGTNDIIVTGATRFVFLAIPQI